MSIREAIKNIRDYKSEVVDIPEWNIKVDIRSCSAGELHKWLKERAEGFAGNLQLVCLSLYEDDKRVFQTDEIELLAEKSNREVLRRLIDAANRVNFGEDLKKN